MTDPAVPWWREAVIYEVYVRSFADAGGDGTGDLAGAASRLPYLAELGVDAVWLTPFYPSPGVDAGYDVTDYRGVDSQLGTLADLDQFVNRAHQLALRVIIDLVPNHTAGDHAWFQAALAAPPGSAERARYLFRDGQGRGGAEPPNDWRSVFGGPAWTRVTEADGRPGQWYLHLFTAEQPDLDWTNPEVRAEFESILRFWFDRGVDGFRIDVAHGLAKDPEMPNLNGQSSSHDWTGDSHPHWDLDEVHDVYRAWRQVADEYAPERTFVAEAWVQTPERLARYLRPGELHTAFNFGFLVAEWDAGTMRKAVVDSIAALDGVGAPATWVLSNHDVHRHVTRYGGGRLGTRRARAAALLMLALPGGAYVYQGEELGLPEVTDLADGARRDPVFSRTGGREKGRDGCRIPLPWSGGAPPYGFGPAPEGSQPWLPQPDGWGAFSVERQAADPGSMLALYRQALRLRHELAALGDGTMTWLEGGPDVLAFTGAPGFACVVNFGAAAADPPADLRGARLLLASAPLGPGGRLPGDSAAWYAM